MYCLEVLIGFNLNIILRKLYIKELNMLMYRLVRNNKKWCVRVWFFELSGNFMIEYYILVFVLIIGVLMFVYGWFCSRGIYGVVNYVIFVFFW